MAQLQRTDLEPDKRAQYDALRRRYATEADYRAVVDLYRNLNQEDEMAAHWMALHDMTTYVHADGTFRPMTVGYSQRELEFLVNKGVKLL